MLLYVAQRQPISNSNIAKKDKYEKAFLWRRNYFRNISQNENKQHLTPKSDGLSKAVSTIYLP